MKLCIVNSAEKQKKSELRTFLQYFLKGYTLVCSTDFDLLYLNPLTDPIPEQLNRSENLILAFEIEQLNDVVTIEKALTRILKQLPDESEVSVSLFILNTGTPGISKKEVEPQLQFLIEKSKHFYNGIILIDAAESKSKIGKSTFNKIEDSGVHFAKTTELRLIKSKFIN